MPQDCSRVLMVPRVYHPIQAAHPSLGADSAPLTIGDGPMTGTDPYYIDESTTGRRFDTFRGPAKATIAARWPPGADLDWLAESCRLARRQAGDVPELKSGHILDAAALDASLRRAIDAAVGRAEIVIVDFYWQIQSTLGTICEVFGIDSRLAGNPAAVLSSGKVPADLAWRFLERAQWDAVELGALGTVEYLLREAVGVAGLSGNATIVDREELAGMGTAERREAASRIATALGASFHPDTIADAAAAEHERWRPLGAISIRALHSATVSDLTYDHGRPRAFETAEKAHDRVVEQLRRTAEGYLHLTTRPGRMIQDDSARLLGLKAADLAAAIAAEIYEQYPHDRRAGAAAIVDRFDRVLLNAEWLR